MNVYTCYDLQGVWHTRHGPEGTFAGASSNGPSCQTPYHIFHKCVLVPWYELPCGVLVSLGFENSLHIPSTGTGQCVCAVVLDQVPSLFKLPTAHITYPLSTPLIVKVL